ncbi:MAG: O-antigen ligase family protein [Cyanobacteria bacterium P01_A01_bin.105]
MSVLALEKLFTLVALLFYTDALAFRSLFAASEGGAVAPSAYNPLDPLLSLLQHSIFLASLLLLGYRAQATLATLLRNKAMCALLLVSLISILWSAKPEVTEPRSLALMETTVFGIYFAARYTLREQLRWVSWVIAVPAVLSLLMAGALPGNAIESGVHAGALRGILIHKNLLARLMVLGVMAMTLNLQGEPRRLKQALLALTLGAVVLSTSKSALIVLFLLWLLWLLHRTVHLSLNRAIPIWCVSLLIVGGGGTILMASAEKLLTAAGRDITLSGRTPLWAALIDKIQERPWFGYGYLGFWHGYDGESAYVGKYLANAYLPPHAHNGFFELLLAFGLVGGGLFLLTFVLNYQAALRLGRATGQPIDYWPVMYLAYIVLYNQTESSLINHNSIYWVLYIALSFSRFVVPVGLASGAAPLNREGAEEEDIRPLAPSGLAPSGLEHAVGQEINHG